MAGRFASVRSAVVSMVGVALLCLLVLAVPTNASAEPPKFARFCEYGSSAGQCALPRGLAVSPTNGHLYVADQTNNRIDEFTAWGEFVKAWGWGVDDGSSELQVCTTESGCQKGIAGTGAGQFAEIGAVGVAVDSTGDIYVVDLANHRVQKFDPDGSFLLMFGSEVDQGPNNPGDVCTAAFIAGGDTCGAGTAGTGNGQFSSNWAIGNIIAIGNGDEVYVGDENRIQVFNSSGVYQRQLPIPQPGSVGEIAVDPASGDIYIGYPNGRFDFEETLPDVYRLDETTGAVLDTLEVRKPSAIGVDSSGTVFVFDEMLIVNGSTSDPDSHRPRVLVFDESGNLIEKFAEFSFTDEIPRSMGIAPNTACFSGEDLGIYVASYELSEFAYTYIQAFGPAPDPAKCAPPDVPPSIEGQFASSVGTDSAVLRAEINPHYFTPPVGTTTYHVQWATADCINGGGWEAGCVQTVPAPPGETLDSTPGNTPVTTDGISLSGLTPATEYRFRFVAERERGAGADPPSWIVIGEGGEPGVEGEEARFTTFVNPTEPDELPPCLNDPFRLGAGGPLRDCRGYELISPLDKAGGDIQARLNLVAYETRQDQASTSGDALTFSAYRAFEDPQSGPFASQFLTRRTSAGWDTEAISPPQEGEAFVNPLMVIDNLYRIFNHDLSQGWLMTDTEPVLGLGGRPGRPNLYRRDNVNGSFEACTTSTLPPISPDAEVHGPQMQGITEDGNLAVIRVENKLTEDASSGRKSDEIPLFQIYVCSFEGGEATMRLVSKLPNGSPSELENSTGGPTNQKIQLDQGRTESLENALSADGSKVFWTGSTALDAETPGALYLRLNPAAEDTASGECEESEPTKACTVLVNAGPARFWKAADDGSIAIFSDSANELNEFEVATGETRPIAPQVVGVLGASEDVGRVYFLSKAQIGGRGEAGQPNLYLYDRSAGETTFVGTLSALDATQGNGVPSPGNPEPAWHTARVTPDGSTVAFNSSDPDLAEEVAGYDNTDQATGLPAAEIYRYQVDGAVVCVSCNRTGARPDGREVQNRFGNNPVLPAASLLPPWLNSLYAPRVLSDDGQRIFFEAFEPLVVTDVNDKSDVYQWEALGRGNCTEADSAFDPASDGCVSLITSGTSSTDSRFIDASPSGDDVFVRTASSLVGWDPGAIDIYDARAGGGFPAPPIPPTECNGENECQGPQGTPPPLPPTGTTGPSSGNVKEGKPKPKKCRKGTHRVKRKGKVRCVKNKKHPKAHKSRRAGR